MKRIYLNTLTPEEVTQRLKNGEVIRSESNINTISLVNGILVRKSGLYTWINDNLCVSDNESLYYFEEEEEPFVITETGAYKTKDGKKVYVSFIGNYVYGVVDGKTKMWVWDLNGYSDSNSPENDIIDKWED